MDQQKRQAFTLVELIVVITILAILWTIAFISLQWYSTQARDSTRISDLGSMKTSLELFQLEAGKYPLPTDGVDVTYSWATVWNQGSFGDTVYSNLDRLDKIPTDPLTDKQYTYSVTATRNQYQLWGMVEGDDVALGGLTTAHAGTTEAYAYIAWTYNEQMTKSLSWTTCNVLAVPSIITNDTTVTDLQQIISSGSLVYRGYKNLPASFKGSKFKFDWWFDFAPNNLVAYSDTSSCEPLTDKTSYTARVQLLEGLQTAYSGTLLQNEGEIKNILALEINTSSPSNEVINYAGNYVNNVLGGNISGWWTTQNFNNCDFNWDTVTHNTSATAYENSSVSFWNSCNSELRLCTDGTLNWTFTFSWCTTDWATWTFNLSQTTVTQWTNVTISNTCSQAPTSYTSSNTAVATVAWTTITTLSAGTTDITPVWWACWDNVWKTLTVNPIPNSCNSTQPTNAALTTWSPTSVNQAWQSNNPSNACYFNCNSLYGSNGTSCVLASDCWVSWLTEITLTNGQTWSCKNLWATTVWNGTDTPTSCGGISTTNCNSSLTYLWDYYQWWRNEPVNTTTTVATYNWTFSWLLWHNNFVLWEDTYWDWWWSEVWSSSSTRWTWINPQWPCATGWHVPSQSEWQLACNTISWTSCANNSTTLEVMKDTLRLPFAGHRRWDNGNYSNQSGYGLYWSSTLNSSHAYNLFFIAGSILPAYSNNRAYGFSVRCLKN